MTVNMALLKSAILSTHCNQKMNT